MKLKKLVLALFIVGGVNLWGASSSSSNVVLEKFSEDEFNRLPDKIKDLIPYIKNSIPHFDPNARKDSKDQQSKDFEKWIKAILIKLYEEKSNSSRLNYLSSNFSSDIFLSTDADLPEKFIYKVLKYIGSNVKDNGRKVSWNDEYEMTSYTVTIKDVTTVINELTNSSEYSLTNIPVKPKKTAPVKPKKTAPVDGSKVFTSWFQRYSTSDLTGITFGGLYAAKMAGVSEYPRVQAAQTFLVNTQVSNCLTQSLTPARNLFADLVSPKLAKIERTLIPEVVTRNLSRLTDNQNTATFLGTGLLMGAAGNLIRRLSENYSNEYLKTKAALVGLASATNIGAWTLIFAGIAPRDSDLRKGLLCTGGVIALGKGLINTRQEYCKVDKACKSGVQN